MEILKKESSRAHGYSMALLLDIEEKIIFKKVILLILFTINRFLSISLNKSQF